MNFHSKFAQLNQQFGQTLQTTLQQINPKLDEQEIKQGALQVFGNQIYSLLPRKQNLLSSSIFKSMKLQAPSWQSGFKQLKAANFTQRLALKNQKRLQPIEKIVYYPMQTIIAHIQNAEIQREDAQYVAQQLQIPTQCALYNQLTKRFSIQLIKLISGDQLQIGHQTCTFANISTEIDPEIIQELIQTKMRRSTTDQDLENLTEIISLDGQLILLSQSSAPYLVYNLQVLASYPEKVEPKPVQREEFDLDEFDEKQFLLFAQQKRTRLFPFKYCDQFTLNNIHMLLQCQLDVSETIIQEMEAQAANQIKAIILEDKARKAQISCKCVQNVIVLYTQTKQGPGYLEIENVQINTTEFQDAAADLELNTKEFGCMLTFSAKSGQQLKILLNLMDGKKLLYTVGCLMNYYQNKTLFQNLNINSRSEEDMFQQKTEQEVLQTTQNNERMRYLDEVNQKYLIKALN
ncbi:Hypothetical_protein [Hexamita inflata]|uniref:Hypothetical_protein n=1 Tax=Hexamita inflata TaxID=28002 RepID=A0AA86NRE7_9EUKA|nr:Hypothetical protein HINF_LOCUS12163 [Hexamita inflata]